MFTTTYDNIGRMFDRMKVIEMVIKKPQMMNQIKRANPGLGECFVNTWAARAREAMAASKDGAVDMVPVASDKPRDGRPRIFDTPAKKLQLKKSIVKKKAISLTESGQEV